MNRKMLCHLLTVIMAVSTWDRSVAQGGSYLDRIYVDYPVIFVTKVYRGEALRTASGDLCFYRYETEVGKIFKGQFANKRFTFFSESRLMIGSSYLTYFSEVDAKKYRILVSYGGVQTDSACRKLQAGFLLLPNETHRLQDVWDGKALRSYVELTDSEAASISSHVMHKTATLVDFDYVKGKLTKK